MNRSRFFELAKWPLLLIIAAAGLWFFGDQLDPRRTVSGDGGTAADASDLRLQVQADSSRVLVLGFPEDDLRALRGREEALAGLLNVYALPGEVSWDSSMLSMDGSRSVTAEGVLFQARHAFLPELRYHVRVEGTARAGGEPVAGMSGEESRERVSAALLDSTFVISRPEGLQAERVTTVYPSADSLPQNLLKFYVQFSGPMSRGQSNEHISIQNAKGEVVEDAFLELPQELWDPQVTRLTILFDPGRIKRGLDRHNLMGVPFEPGERYTLVVDSAMEDGNGLPLGQPFRKEFTVTEPDREMPDHEQWSIDVPEPGTRNPLKMNLDEPMDRALLQRLVTVYLDDGGGEAARGGLRVVPRRVFLVRQRAGLPAAGRLSPEAWRPGTGSGSGCSCQTSRGTRETIIWRSGG